MEFIYLAFVDTPGIFSALLHRYLKQKYIHVVLSMDPYLDEAYSFGRRNPAIPLLAGFEKEDKGKIWRVFPDAGYQICRVACSMEQKQWLKRTLSRDYGRRFRLHYAVAALPFIAMGISCPLPGQFTCSSYVAKLLSEAGIWDFGKNYSLVTPKDFLEHGGRKVIFEGKLSEFLQKNEPAGELQKHYALETLPSYANVAAAEKRYRNEIPETEAIYG